MHRSARFLLAAVLALAALAPPALAAEPRYVVASVAEAGTLALDFNTLERRGSVRSIDGFIALTEPGQDGMALAAMTTEVDCDRRTWRFTAVTQYDAAGREIRRRGPDDWAPARPGTNAGNTLAVTCGEVEGMDIDLPRDIVAIRSALLRIIQEQTDPAGPEIET